MELKDLLTAPNSELTDEQLEEKLRQLKKFKVMTKVKSSTSIAKSTKSSGKSNQNKQIEKLLKSLPKDELMKILAGAKP